MALLIGIWLGSLLSVLSPLLTTAFLWQKKEWRVDRMREHLRHEGCFVQLVGVKRIVAVAASVFLAIAGYAWLPEEGSVLLGLCLLAMLNAVHLARGQQRMPTWTKKTFALIVASLCINIVLIWLLVQTQSTIGILLLPLIQPLLLVIAWTAFLPIDSYLKKRILYRAKRLRDAHKELIVIAIAGSVGKTTTKELLKHLLQDKKPLATPAHVNTELGVASWFCVQRETLVRCPIVIVEMGAYRKGEIALMSNILKPSIGILTSLGSDHLALFGSEEAIIEANAELLAALPTEGTAFIDGDNAGCLKAREKAQCNVITVGLNRSVNVCAEAFEEDLQGINIRLQGDTIFVPLHGQHMITNILLAMSVAKQMGIKKERMVELLRTFTALKGTFNIHQERGVTIVDDTYNISPLSVRAALMWASTRKERPRILLTSGLLELGQEEEKHVRSFGKQAATCIDRVLVTTDVGKHTFEEGFGRAIERLSKQSVPVPEGALLLCLGRMPEKAIRSLLP